MAVFVIINAGMTAAEARSTGKRSSFVEAKWYSPNPERGPVEVWRSRLGDDEVPDAEAAAANNRPRVYIGSLLNHPLIADEVKAFEKTGLAEAKKAGRMEGDIYDTSRRYGPPKEWDHYVLSLSAEESARLREAGPEAMETFRQIVIAGMRTNPELPGYRAAVISDVHDEEGHLHIHGIVNRFGVTFSGPRPQIMPSADVTRDSFLKLQSEEINKKLDEAGLGFIQITNASSPGRSNVFEDKRGSDAAKEAAAEMIEKAGGAPSATIGTGPSKGASFKAAAENVDAETQVLINFGVLSQRHLANLQAEKQKIEEEMERVAAAAAAAQHGIAAIAQRDEARAENERLNGELTTANEKIEGLVASLALAQEETRATKNVLEQTQLDLSQARSTIGRLEGELEASTQREVALRDTNRDLVNTVAERDSTIAQLEGQAEEMGRELDELRPLPALLQETEEKLTAAQATIDEVTGQRDEISARLKTTEEQAARDKAAFEAALAAANERAAAAEANQRAMQTAVDTLREQLTHRDAEISELRPLRTEVAENRSLITSLQQQIAELTAFVASQMRNLRNAPASTLARVRGLFERSKTTPEGVERKALVLAGGGGAEADLPDATRVKDPDLAAVLGWLREQGYTSLERAANRSISPADILEAARMVGYEPPAPPATEEPKPEGDEGTAGPGVR